MKTWYITIIMFFSFLFYSKRILRFLDKFLFFISFVFEKDQGQMNCKIISFSKKHKPSYWAGQLDYHLFEYYIRVLDDKGRSHDMSIVYREDYEALAKICHQHSDQRVVLLVNKKIFRGMYEVTNRWFVPAESNP